MGPGAGFERADAIEKLTVSIRETIARCVCDGENPDDYKPIGIILCPATEIARRSYTKDSPFTVPAQLVHYSMHLVLAKLPAGNAGRAGNTTYWTTNTVTLVTVDREQTLGVATSKHATRTAPAEAGDTDNKGHSVSSCVLDNIQTLGQLHVTTLNYNQAGDAVDLIQISPATNRKEINELGWYRWRYFGELISALPGCLSVPTEFARSDNKEPGFPRQGLFFGAGDPVSSEEFARILDYHMTGQCWQAMCIN